MCARVRCVWIHLHARVEFWFKSAEQNKSVPIHVVRISVKENEKRTCVKLLTILYYEKKIERTLYSLTRQSSKASPPSVCTFKFCTCAANDTIISKWAQKRFWWHIIRCSSTCVCSQSKEDWSTLVFHSQASSAAALKSSSIFTKTFQTFTVLGHCWHGDDANAHTLFYLYR